MSGTSQTNFPIYHLLKNFISSGWKKCQGQVTNSPIQSYSTSLPFSDHGSRPELPTSTLVKLSERAKHKHGREKVPHYEHGILAQSPSKRCKYIKEGIDGRIERCYKGIIVLVIIMFYTRLNLYLLLNFSQD